MKKFLIPILITSTVAPIATSLIACNKTPDIGTVNLEFVDNIKESGVAGFIKDNFDIKANKEYKFAINFTKVPNEVLADWEGNDLGFGGFVMVSGDLWPLNFEMNKLKVIFNDEDITNEIDKPKLGEPISIGEGHTWEKTDKLLITITWTTSRKGAMVGLLPPHILTKQH